MSITKLEYRVWQQADESHRDEILELKGRVSMADCRFRVTAEREGVDPLSIATQIHWTGELECQFTIEAPALEEVISSAWEKSVKLIGLQTELITRAA